MLSVAVGAAAPLPATGAHDNGPVVNGIHTGVGGANESIVQIDDLGISILGYSCAVGSTSSVRVADDFEVVAGPEAHHVGVRGHVHPHPRHHRRPISQGEAPADEPLLRRGEKGEGPGEGEDLPVEAEAQGRLVVGGGSVARPGWIGRPGRLVDELDLAGRVEDDRRLGWRRRVEGGGQADRRARLEAHRRLPNA